MLEELINKLAKDIRCELTIEEIKMLYGMDNEFNDTFIHCLIHRNAYDDLLKIFKKNQIAQTREEITENTIVFLGGLVIDKVLPTYNLKYIYGELLYTLDEIYNLENLELIVGDLTIPNVKEYVGLENICNVLGVIELSEKNNNLDFSVIDFEADFELTNYDDKSNIVFPKSIKSMEINTLDVKRTSNLPDSLQYLTINNVKNISGFKCPRNLKYLKIILYDLYKREKLASILNTYGEFMGISPDELDIDNPKIISDLKLNDNLEELELFIDKLISFTLPNNLVSLNLPITEEINNIVLPITLKRLFLSKIEDISNLVLPDNLEELHIPCVKSLKDIKMPSNLKVLDIGDLLVLDDIDLNDNIDIYLYGKLIIKSEIKSKKLHK